MSSVAETEKTMRATRSRSGPTGCDRAAQAKELIVMKPSPPSWISARITNSPTKVKDAAGSTEPAPWWTPPRPR